MNDVFVFFETLFLRESLIDWLNLDFDLFGSQYELIYIYLEKNHNLKLGHF